MRGIVTFTLALGCASLRQLAHYQTAPMIYPSTLGIHHRYTPSVYTNGIHPRNTPSESHTITPTPNLYLKAVLIALERPGIAHRR